MLLAAIDWTNVIVASIVGLPSIIAAVFAGRVHRQIQTPSGQKLGVVAEYSNDTAIANNLLLSKQNGPTKPADRETLHEEGLTAPRIPVEARKED